MSEVFNLKMKAENGVTETGMESVLLERLFGCEVLLHTGDTFIWRGLL